ncbi:hypothetical protein JCM11491_000818 [Sporobolomyces phaffii]
MAAPSSSSLRLTSTSSDTTRSEFIQFTATMRIPIPPVFSTNSNGNPDAHGDGGMDGVKEVLAGWVMRYLPPLHAVVLSFDPNPRFLHPAAVFETAAVPFDTNAHLPSPPPTPSTSLDDDESRRLGTGELVRLKTLPMIDGSGFTLADVEWKGLGWRPQVGMKLVGTPTLSTSSHVSLLLHNLFNASIPSSHIPKDQYEFDPTCPVPAVVLERRQQQPKSTAKSAEELEQAAKKARREALGIEGDDEVDSDDEDADAEKEAKMEEDAEEEEDEFEEQGWWVDKQTRQPLGGQQGRIEFTLVALSTSNSLLSCTGSLLSDPFTPSALASLAEPSANSSESALALLQEQTLRSGHAQNQPRLSDDEGSDGSTDSSDSEGEGEAASGDDDDGVGTGIPLHQGAPSKTEDASKSDSDDDSSSSESESDASSRSPSPEPVPEKQGKKTKAEKKGKPPVVGKSKVETKVVEEEPAKGGKAKKEKKRKEVGSPEKGSERKSKKVRKE